MPLPLGEVAERSEDGEGLASPFGRGGRAQRGRRGQTKKAARPSQSPAVTALPKGEPRVCAPLYRRIPAAACTPSTCSALLHCEVVRPYALSIEGRSVGGDAHIAPYAMAAPRHQTKGIFRAPARVTFGRSPKSDQKVCLKPKVSRLPARYALSLSAACTTRSREFNFVVRSKGSSPRLRRCR